MRFLFFMLLISVLAGSIRADALVIEHTSTLEQLFVSVIDKDEKIHRARIIVRSEDGIAIGEGETSREGIARFNIPPGKTLNIEVNTPDGQTNNQVYEHLYH